MNNKPAEDLVDIVDMVPLLEDNYSVDIDLEKQNKIQLI